jgi:hypothetical protein
MSERKLPVGMTEFDQLIVDLKAQFELPTSDEASLKFAIASIIMHLGPDDSHKSLEFFYKRLVAGASKQVAHTVFQEVKKAQEEKLAAEKAAAEAAKNEPQQQ